MQEKVIKVLVRFDKMVTMLPKSVLIRIGTREYWLPRKLCRNIRTKNNLSGSLSIPGWLYLEKFGEAPETSDIEEVIIHHVPEKIEVKPTTPNDGLIR